jgi:hypothetical protein
VDFWLSDAGPARLAANRERYLSVAADGSFRAYDVLPGSYTLVLHVSGKTHAPAIAHYSEPVVIPEKDGSAGEIVDLGTRVVRRAGP